MTQYSVLVNKKGTILSFKIIDADPAKFPVKKLKGSHFSKLIGFNCKKDLQHILEEASKTQKPANFQTYIRSTAGFDGPVVEWTVRPKSGTILDVLFPARYELTGKSEE